MLWQKLDTALVSHEKAQRPIRGLSNSNARRYMDGFGHLSIVKYLQV